MYFRAYFHLRFKHVVQGTNFGYQGCLKKIVSERKEGVEDYLKMNSLGVGAGTDI